MANAPELVTESGYLHSERDKLINFLKQYANIVLAGTRGEPPRKYELEFNMRAYVPDEDGISVGRKHRILITLPMGFPQNAPKVEALSPMYHPALNEDDDSFAIAAQWARQPSLPDLVIYLASLITGRIYKVENPVNPDATEWYDEHKKDLPLDSPAKSNKEQESLLGMLEEDDFNPAFGMDEEIPEEDPGKYQDQIQEIRDLLAQNQLYILGKRLNELPPSLWFPERDEAEEKVKKAKQETKKLFAMAKKQEDAGNYGKAVEYAQAILARIPDHPDAQALAQRLQQSSFITASLTDALSEQESATVKGATQERTQASGESGPPIPKQKMAWLPEDFPLRRILLGALGVVVAFWIFTLAMSDQSTLGMINRRIQDGQNYIDKKQYANAKEVLESARDNMPGLTVLWFRKGGLKKKINKMLAEPALVESTHRSRVKYKGNYVDRDTAMALGEMARMEQAAAQQLANGQDDEAIRSYSQALNYISAYPVLADEQKRLDAIVKKTSVGLLLKQAAQAEKQNNWDNADDLYREAETRLRESAAESAAITAEYAPIVQKRRSGFRLRRTLGQAAEAMSKNRLDSARSYLQQARQMQATSQEISREDSILIDATHVQLQIYEMLPKAKQAFERRQWKEAAALYQQAISLADNSPPEIRQSLADLLRQVERTRDVAFANQALREASRAAGRRDWASAVRLEDAALARLSSGHYDQSPEVVELQRRLEGQLAQHRQHSGQANLGKVLEARGAAYFRSSFPNIPEKDLASLKATFLRREGARQIYELSCMDSSGGRASKLAVLFAYDERSGQWTPIRN